MNWMREGSQAYIGISVNSRREAKSKAKPPAYPPTGPPYMHSEIQLGADISPHVFHLFLHHWALMTWGSKRAAGYNYKQPRMTFGPDINRWLDRAWTASPNRLFIYLEMDFTYVDMMNESIILIHSDLVTNVFWSNQLPLQLLIWIQQIILGALHF